MTLPAAILWDNDGTFVDTERYWVDCETELLAAYGLPWSQQQGKDLAGTSLYVSAQMIIDATGLPLTPQETMDQLVYRVCQKIRTLGAQCLPGTRELAESARAKGIKNILVTSSFKPIAEAVMEATGGIMDDFVAGDQVTHAKPHPEPFLKAAEIAGVNIEDCLVLEDSIPGLGAAVACGGHAVVIPQQVPIEWKDTYSRARSCEQLTWPVIERIMQGENLNLGSKFDA